MQKSFVSSITGPEQISNMRPTPYGGINSMQQQQQQQNSNYDHMQSHQTDQAHLVGIDGGGFMNQFLHNNKGQQEMTPQFMEAAVGAETDMGLFSGLFMTGSTADQHHGFLKNMEHDNSRTNNASVFQGKSVNSGTGYSGIGRSMTGASRFSTNSGGDVMTVDFLGVGGPRVASLHEQQNHSQDEEEELDFEQKMQGLHPCQQQVSQGQETMEKPIWEG